MNTLTISQSFDIDPTAESAILLSKSHLHKLLLGLRWRGLAAGVELLVEELDDAHVVLDAEVVEERLADLKQTQDSNQFCLIFV